MYDVFAKSIFEAARAIPSEDELRRRQPERPVGRPVHVDRWPRIAFLGKRHGAGIPVEHL